MIPRIGSCALINIIYEKSPTRQYKVYQESSLLQAFYTAQEKHSSAVSKAVKGRKITG